MKKGLIIASLLAALFVVAGQFGFSVDHAFAQGISGDALCGGAGEPCTPEHLEELARRLFLIFASIGTALLFIFIIVRVLYSVYLYMANNDPGALARARAQSFNMMIGYGMILAVFGGIFFVALQIFGVDDKYLKLLEYFSEGFVQHAYAFENTLSSDNAYDIIIAGISLAMQFFVYPGLIAMWVAAGFKFVYSQGNPEGLKTARNWLLVAVIVTVIAFTLQGFILAFRGTALEVFGGAGTGAEQETAAPASCTGRPSGSPCTAGNRPGTCGYNEEREFGCYVR